METMCTINGDTVWAREEQNAAYHFVTLEYMVQIIQDI